MQAPDNGGAAAGTRGPGGPPGSSRGPIGCLDALPFQQAERALRLEQQTSRDPLQQEELLVQQEVLLRKVKPQAHAAKLGALELLLQQHPQLYTYQQQLYSFPGTRQEEAVGALVLLPLRELLAFKRLRKSKCSSSSSSGSSCSRAAAELLQQSCSSCCLARLQRVCRHASHCVRISAAACCCYVLLLRAAAACCCCV
ncbi:hypothetical protein ETH_00028505 [Eimeria tenella]|uniref:Uncharacterized protein n=1 Tax=Eimeria tenella TaxID=5802 RepID=U6KY14_EIMTE|nr:hypothetical protein ETH_00028505 [Eimeria tenella]CDJ41838.1 hypothetical protein ETH_00028505 [Eimeria tenella]|eukprot:XP_013232588.1 hypothetical protein ETH_00028505 [Eimeria tenella]